MAKRLLQLFTPIHASTLSLFRILFGLVMIYQMLYYIRIDYAFQLIAGPEILFHYPYLEFLKPLPVGILRAMQWAMLLSALMIALGIRTRYASIFLFITYSYFTLVDKTLFNNHLYLFMLLALLLCFVDSDKLYSIRSRLSKTKLSPYIDSWQVYIFRFMIFIVYFYGGIVKINPDWFNGSIVKATLAGAGTEPDSSLVYFLTYGGLAYDLIIGFLLLYRPTRLLGVIFVLIFNLTNHFYLFDDIGVFPFAMIGATIIFFDPKRIAQLIDGFLGANRKPKKKKRKDTVGEIQETQWSKKQQLVGGVLIAFVLFQLLFPFRYLLFTDNPEWSGIASRFAWRMKMQTKTLDSFDMTVQDMPDGAPQEVDYKAFLSLNQEKNILNDPYNIVQLGKYIAEEAKRRGMTNPTVKANIKVHFNQRPAQLMIKPEVPIEKISLSPFEDQYWLVPLE